MSGGPGGGSFREGRGWHAVKTRVSRGPSEEFYCNGKGLEVGRVHLLVGTSVGSGKKCGMST